MQAVVHMKWLDVHLLYTLYHMFCTAHPIRAGASLPTKNAQHTSWPIAILWWLWHVWTACAHSCDTIWYVVMRTRPYVLPAYASLQTSRRLNITPLPTHTYDVLVYPPLLSTPIFPGARFSGPTVHFVDEEYDTGAILAQRVVPVLPDDTPERLAARVLQQEHQVYPEAVAALVEGRVAWREDGVPYMMVAR